MTAATSTTEEMAGLDHLREQEHDALAELEPRGRAAAERVNSAGASFVAAVEERAQAERALIGVLALAGWTKRDAVHRARSDSAAEEVRRLLATGGESAPTLRIELPVQAA